MDYRTLLPDHGTTPAPSAYFRVLAPLLLAPLWAEAGDALIMNPRYTLVCGPDGGGVKREGPPCPVAAVRALCAAGVLRPLTATDAALAGWWEGATGGSVQPGNQSGHSGQRRTRARRVMAGTLSPAVAPLSPRGRV
jgi:hypothetical protein